MLICGYCGTGNADGAPFCVQCGAPRRHMVADVLVSPARLVALATEDVTAWVVQGYDASAWNGDQNPTITRLKAQYAHLRGGYGNSYLDPRYPVYRDNCDQWQIERGMYWYCYAGLDWKAHATAIASQWKASPGKLDLTLDFETTTLDAPSTATWAYNLVQEVQYKTGEVPTIYTGPYWWNTHVSRNNWANQLPLWIACWNSISTAPIVPYDWAENTGINRWRHWQWSADGNKLANAYGFFNGDVDIDLNRFNGDVKTFNSLYGTSILPLGDTEPEPPIESTLLEYLYRVRITAFPYMNVRQGPSTTYKDLGDIYALSTLPVLKELGDWLLVGGWINKNYTRKL